MTSSGAELWFEGFKDHLRDRENRADRPPITSRRYEILEKIGEGAAAQVFRARDRDLGRTVAIKILREPLATSAEVVERFQREAKTAAGLSHPNLVAVYDAAVEDGRPYLVMELIEGASLSELLKRKSEPVASLVALIEKVARGVAAAHAQGVVHRDLKPGNILVGAGGEPKVADFGLAYVCGAESHLTRTGVALGTPLYMAPEQVQGRSSQVGPPTDVYALGVILYEMLVGRPPHQGESVTEVYGRILNDDPILPRRLDPKLPFDLETIAMKALDKEAPRRYPSAREFADDVRRFLDGEPILARPPGLASMTRKIVRRHRLAVAVGLALLAATLAWAVVDYRRRAVDTQVQKLLETAQPALTAAAQADYRASVDWPSLHEQVVRARAAIEEASKLAPGSALVHFRLGLSWSIVGEDAKAQEAWRETLRLDPAFSPAHYQLGRVLLARALVGTAGTSTGDRKRRRPQATKVAEEAAAEFELAISGGGLEDEIQRRIAEAMLARAKGDVRGTRRLAEEGLKDFGRKDGVEWFYLLAAVSSERNQSLTRLNQALALAPQQMLARFIRGLTLHENHDYEGALRDFEAVATARPTFAVGLVKRGDLRALANDMAGASADFAAALRLEPDLAMAWTGTAYVDAEEKRYDDAFRHIDEALRLDPEAARPRLIRVGIYVIQGRWAEAEAEITVVIDAAGEELWERHERRAAIRSTLERWPGAKEDLREALRLAPKDWPSRRDVERQLKQWEKQHP